MLFKIINILTLQGTETPMLNVTAFQLCMYDIIYAQ